MSVPVPDKSKIDFTPCGFKVLIDVVEYETATHGGIITCTNEFLKKERNGMDIGRVLKFGPIAFKGYSDCETPEDWGVKVGDLVEFVRFDGKLSRLALDYPEQCGGWRVINDSDIIGVIAE